MTAPTTPLLVDRQGLAALLGLSLRNLDRRRTRGEILDPTIRGRQPRWLIEDVEDWLRAGAPPAQTWRQQRQA